MKRLIATLLVLTLLFGCTAAFAVEYTDKDTVKKVQRALNDAGYDCGRPDGVAGKNTKKAITSYQQDKELEQTGTINDALLISLGLKEEKADDEDPDAAESETELPEEEEQRDEEETSINLYGADVPAIEEVFPGFPITLPETAEALRALFDIDNLQMPVLDYKSIYNDLMDDGKASFEAPEGLIDIKIWALYNFSNGEAYIDLGQMDAIKDGIVTCTAVEDRSVEASFLGELFMMTYQSESYMDFVAADTDKSAENVKDSSLTRSVIDISLNRDFVGTALAMYKDALMEYPEVSYLIFENNEGEEARFTVSLTIKKNVVYDEKEVIQDSTLYIWKRSFDASGNPIEGSDVFYTSDPSYPAD